MHIKATGLLLEAVDGSTDGQVLLLPPISGAEANIRFPGVSGTLLTTTAVENKADLVAGVVPLYQLPPGFQPEILLGTYVNSTTFEDEDEEAYTPLIDKLYVDTVSNTVYRWTGLAYTATNIALALGETSSSAYRGDRGKVAYDHTSLTDNPHNVTKSQVGLGNVNNTSDADKPISSATATALSLKVNLYQDLSTKTTDYTLALEDVGVIIEMDNEEDSEVTVPLDVFPIKTSITILRGNSGEVNIIGASGVSFISADAHTSLRTQGSGVTLYQKSANIWYIIGDLKEVV